MSLADPHHYGFQRFLTATERWKSADDKTRSRIVELAKQLLRSETQEPDTAKDEPLNQIRSGYMPAVWLLLELEPSWLDSQPREWWHRWSWYFVRELHPYLHDEPNEPKQRLLELLFARAGDDVTTAITRLAKATDPESSNMLGGILELSAKIAPGSLSEALDGLMMKGVVSVANIRPVARFTLNRDADRALQACFATLVGSTGPDPDAASIVSAVALLSEKPGESWTQVASYLRARTDLASRVLGEYAQTGQFRVSSSDSATSAGNAFSTKQVGELALMLLEYFPINADPVHDSAYSVGPDDSARDLRNQLIGWLAEQRELEAVEALKAIERQFGTEYPGLRRPRATAERGYRLSRWVPTPVESVAAVLFAADKRLVRSNEDALDAVVTAIELYAHGLRHSSPSDLEDLWNRPKNATPTPKEEERVSDKISAAIRTYLERYAVTADREVQIFRRLVSRKGGGAPGSEVDVLCRIPASATVEKDPIAVPIEVKFAHNPEARDGMRNQLASRYMNELGTASGAYVVVWMEAPNIGTGYKPLWPTPTAAETELRMQAEALKSEGLDIRVIVVDASLTRDSRKSTSKTPSRLTERSRTAAPARKATKALRKTPERAAKKARPTKKR